MTCKKWAVKCDRTSKKNTYKDLGKSCFDDACHAKMYNAQTQMSLETQQGNGYFALKCD